MVSTQEQGLVGRGVAASTIPQGELLQHNYIQHGIYILASHQFIIHFSATSTEPATQLAFLDARRLARIRLAREPLKEPPISELGFDPILSMPTLEDFKKMVLKRSCPIKALLLDQGFSAGVGNWVAGMHFFSLSGYDADV